MVLRPVLQRLASGLALAALGLLATEPTVAQGIPARVGKWSPPQPWPIIGIHAAVLPTGKVMHLTYIDSGTMLETAATVWNPATGGFVDVSPGFGDMFCSGQNLMSNGELFIAGGFRPQNCPVTGTRETYIFDPFTLQWRETGLMRFARFYPTVLNLPDERMLIVAGQGDRCQYVPVMEIYDQAKGLSVVRGPNRIMRDYPRAFLLSSGEIAEVSPEPATSILNTAMRFWTTIAVTRLGRQRYEAAAFYVPGFRDRIMLCGGYLKRNAANDLDNPTESCEAIDLAAARPAWRDVAPMHAPRGDMNAVLLPDGKVMIVGGGEHHRYSGPVLNGELYDPASNTWTVIAPQRLGRMYHSTAVLLPDGRVLSAGQDDDGSSGFVSGSYGEIYSPPYLFKGPRPQIRNAPTQVEYGQAVSVNTTQITKIRSVVLMGLGAVTHSTNVGQRFVPLSFGLSGNTLRVTVTRNPNEAPPGYYMLFVVNDRGVPSVARMVQLMAVAGASAGGQGINPRQLRPLDGEADLLGSASKSGG